MARRYLISARDDAGGGFTLVEILVSITVFGILLIAFFIFYRSQALALSQQERFLNAKQNAQIGLDFVMRELRTAGSRPAPEIFAGCGVAASTATTCSGVHVVAGVSQKGFPAIVSANGTSVRILADYRGNNLGDAADGCPDDAAEDVTYTYNAGTGRLLRTPVGGAATPVLEGIAAGGFRIRYYGYGTGSPPPYVEFQSGGGNLTVNEMARVKHMVITITTTAPGRISGAPITTTQQSTVYVRNPPC
jgi:prepilin-type N-terminal cleavage/methylation domain-containing protein